MLLHPGCTDVMSCHCANLALPLHRPPALPVPCSQNSPAPSSSDLLTSPIHRFTGASSNTRVIQPCMLEPDQDSRQKEEEWVAKGCVKVDASEMVQLHFSLTELKIEVKVKYSSAASKARKALIQLRSKVRKVSWLHHLS